MSAFGIGTNVQEIDRGELRGKMYHIACKVWFTAGCKVSPLSFKFQGEDGMIQTVHNITVHYAEEKNYSGIPSMEYGCEAVIGGLRHEFKLIFYMEACKWVMILPK